ncbi:MAG: hypothetical protein K6B74_14175 [Ruminococcus sp.]|nr:hypothetical protein [Ruminococcus sp.]
MPKYAVVLYPDKKGLIRLINLMSGSLMVDFRIKPHITLAVFESRSEILARYWYRKLAQMLKPAKLLYYKLTRSTDDIIFAESKRSENLYENLRVTESLLFPRFKKLGGDFPLESWVPITAVAYKVEGVDIVDYSRYVSRVFKEFECSTTTAALVRLDPFTEIYVTKLYIN